MQVFFRIHGKSWQNKLYFQYSSEKINYCQFINSRRVTLELSRENDYHDVDPQNQVCLHECAVTGLNVV